MINFSKIFLNATIALSFFTLSGMHNDKNIPINTQKALLKAISDKDLQQVKQLFAKHSIDPNQPIAVGDDNSSPLCLAACFGSEEIFRYLVDEKKGNVHSLQPNQETPYLAAAATGNVGILKYIIEREKKNPHLAFQRHNHLFQQKSALSYATSEGKEEVVQYLINQPEFNHLIDGPIALSIATKNKKQNIVETLLAHGVPPLPHNEVPNFFYDNEINNLFDFKTLPIIAYTQMPIPEDSSITPKPLNVNIYQLKVAKQCGVLEDCIQEQLKEAAQKLGGTPEDHKDANPIYGGSCGYHAIKNAMLGLMVLSDYDKLAESTKRNNKAEQQKALTHLQKDVKNLTDFQTSDDFDSKKFMEKIHAKIYRIHSLDRQFHEKARRPTDIVQGFSSDRFHIAQPKTEKKLYTLLSKRYQTSEFYSKTQISLLDAKTLVTVLKTLPFIQSGNKEIASCFETQSKELSSLTQKIQIYDLLQQRALFQMQPIYRHAFMLSYNTGTMDGYEISGYGNKNQMHEITIILDKRNSDINVLLLESNNVPDFAIKKIIFDILSLFLDTKKYPLDYSLCKTLNECASYPFDSFISEPQEGLSNFDNLVEDYLKLKQSLESQPDRNAIHKALYSLEKIKHTYFKANHSERSIKNKEIKVGITNILIAYNLLEKIDIQTKNEKKKFREEEIALHRKFGQLEQKDLNEKLTNYIHSKNLDEIIEAINIGANPNYVNSFGRPIIHLAVWNSYEIMKYLIEHGADIEAKNTTNGETPLLCTISNFGYECNHENIKLLLDKNANVNAQDNNGKTPLMLAISNIGYECNHEIIELLLNKNANVNAQDNNGCTPLMYIALNQNQSTQKANLIKLLVEHGADIKARNNNGQSIATVYFKTYNLDALEYFMTKYKIEINIEKLISETPGPFAALRPLRSIYYYPDIIDFLIKKTGFTTASHPKLSHQLLRQVIKREEIDSYGITNMLDRLFEKDFGMNPNIQDNHGWTPLMHAIKERSFIIFKHLIEKHQVNTEIKNEDGKTAFDIANENECNTTGKSFLPSLYEEYLELVTPDPFIEYIQEKLLRH